MKCLSLWQPWASLVAVGAKRIETRSWETPYRGALGIHAAKHWTNEERDIACSRPFIDDLIDTPHFDRRVGINSLPRGALLCIVQLVTVIPVDDLLWWGECIHVKGSDMKIVVSHRENDYGDYTPGRFAWILANVWRPPAPVPMVGHQGLWDIDSTDLMVTS